MCPSRAESGVTGVRAGQGPRSQVSELSRVGVWVCQSRAGSGVTGMSEPGRVQGHRCPSWAGSGDLRHVPAGQESGDREASGFCLVSCSLCSALRSLSWRQETESERWLPAVFVVAHLLVNRYKLLVLETLTAPLLIKPLQLIIIFSLESLRGKQRRRRGRLPFLPERGVLGVLGPTPRPQGNSLSRGRSRGSRLTEAKTQPIALRAWGLHRPAFPVQEPGAQGHSRGGAAGRSWPGAWDRGLL